VRAHVEALRASECFRESELVIIPEANLGNEAQLVAYDLVHYTNLNIIQQYSGKYGIFTVPGSRAEYVLRLSRKFNEHAVMYHDTVVAANPFTAPSMSGRQRLAKVKAEFERQLAMFERVPRTSKNLKTANEVLYSGVANNEGERVSTKREDLAMAMAFGYYWATQYDEHLVAARSARDRFLLPHELPRASAASNVAAVAAPSVPAFARPEPRAKRHKSR